eukprot:CAMPEP_0175036418 /NCGR_PEP_ID=MMETSP0005-20121125/23773_1 /TAXON_ID=420556 /ORGANISM="Ochromonas sp., Strain CCMP1393" /LENGTH=114 /DNA_ID=CAMNT_0016297603 /DNA_START=131 /DNA_END=472 /DNA_ORIENTATION=+
MTNCVSACSGVGSVNRCTEPLRLSLGAPAKHTARLVADASTAVQPLSIFTTDAHLYTAAPVSSLPPSPAHSRTDPSAPQEANPPAGTRHRPVTAAAVPTAVAACADRMGALCRS